MPTYDLRFDKVESDVRKLQHQFKQKLLADAVFGSRSAATASAASGPLTPSSAGAGAGGEYSSTSSPPKVASKALSRFQAAALSAFAQDPPTQDSPTHPLQPQTDALGPEQQRTSNTAAPSQPEPSDPVASSPPPLQRRPTVPRLELHSEKLADDTPLTSPDVAHDNATEIPRLIESPGTARRPHTAPRYSARSHSASTLSTEGGVALDLDTFSREDFDVEGYLRGVCSSWIETTKVRERLTDLEREVRVLRRDSDALLQTEEKRGVLSARLQRDPVDQLLFSDSFIAGMALWIRDFRLTLRLVGDGGDEGLARRMISQCAEEVAKMLGGLQKLSDLQEASSKLREVVEIALPTLFLELKSRFSKAVESSQEAAAQLRAVHSGFLKIISETRRVMRSHVTNVPSGN
jgi:hypothetical protein